MIDIGVNLTSGRFHKDLSEVMGRAREAGVHAQIVTGTSVHASEEALALAQSYPNELYATAGVHPHDAKNWSEESAASLAALAREPGVVALGECGLDFNRNFSSSEDQLRCFEAQLILAVEVQKPVFLHQRDAHEAFMPLLKHYRPQLVGAVVHCFTGTREELEDYLALDCAVGVTGWVCDQRRGAELRELVKHIPADRLMVETDAPYLTPHNLPKKPKGNRNEPAFLPYVIETVAECRGEAPDALARQTAQNARVFFQLT
ncbi:TatD family hydrolase [Marinimicrobium agarilyticum]|uniref:TatD family hydrolase n=1 Tax=Marinimicrobium agarilyticum TaxID=306546 RepID=UPI000402244C|nr:TatD family hydrolase [Marinimicrobium agarilyticum]